MNKAFLEDLCAKIQLPEEDRELAFQEMERQPKRIERFARRMYQRNDVRHLQGLLKIDRKKKCPLVLAVLLCAAEYTFAAYQKKENSGALLLRYDGGYHSMDGKWQGGIRCAGFFRNRLGTQLYHNASFSARPAAVPVLQGEFAW